MAPLIITSPRAVPYSSDKAIPWNYGAEVYYHGVKQDPLTIEDIKVEATIPDIDNITRSSKVTKTGRVFSPEISPPKDTVTPARIPAVEPIPEARGKEPVTHPAQTEVPKEVAEDTSKQEMEEILKIIKKSDYNVVEQLGQTPSKISMLALLLCSKAHAKALVKFLKNAHIPQDTTIDQFEVFISSLAANNGLGFSDADLSPARRKHNKSLHISVECKGITLSHVLVHTGSALNILPKIAFDRLDVEGLVLKPSDIIVRAFDGSKRTVLGELILPVKVGSQTFDSTFFVMDIRPAYSFLLGRPWIHGAGAVTSTLHQKLKYPVKGKVVTVCGEEEYMVSHLQSFRYLEMEGEFFETPCQAFEIVPRVMPVDSPVTPGVTQVPPRMVSLKDAQAAVEEGGSTIWGQLPDLPFKSGKTGLGFTTKGQKMICRERAGQLPFHISKNGVHAIEDDDINFDISDWIFPTPDNGFSNWKTEDVIPISFRQE